MGKRIAALGAACAIPLLATAGQEPGTPRSITHLTPVQSAYLTQCGGCHGIEGVSAPHAVPSLQGVAGSFLCTRAGRAYIVQLPDVALTGMSDRMLAEVMNFVVFDLGAPVPGGSKVRPYTAAEVALLRKRPLIGPALSAYRARIVGEIRARCATRVGVRVYGKGSASRVGAG